MRACVSLPVEPAEDFVQETDAEVDAESYVNSAWNASAGPVIVVVRPVLVGTAGRFDFRQ